MKRSAAVAAMVLVAGLSLCCAAVEDAAVEDAVVQAEKSWAAAVTRSDLNALDAILTSDLIYTHSSAVVEDRGVYTGRIKSGSLRYDAIDHESIVVKAYGDAAVLHCKLRMQGASNGEAFNTYAVVSHVWVRQGGAWKLAAHHATRLP